MTVSKPDPRRVAIIQARLGSTRLPGKVLLDLGGVTPLGLMVRQLRRAKCLDDIWIATSDRDADTPVAAAAHALGVRVFRGDENDVLGRYYAAAKEAGAGVVVRLTGDCPFVDPALVDAAIDLFVTAKADYAANTIERTYPDGLDVEVFSFAALERAHRECATPRLREHVTPYLKTGVYPGQPSGDFRLAHLRYAVDFSHLRWTLDTEEDLEFVREALKRLPRDFSWQDVIGLLTREPDLLSWNRQRKRRIGALEDLRGGAKAARANDRYAKSNRHFEAALQRIPLASQTFSKSFQYLVLGVSPLFLSHGKGARVTDIDGNEYVDYIMSLLANILGYSDPTVDAAIIRQLERGISFSLATELELELAETLCRLMPSAEMVRYGKNGSDATTAAIRLARAHTGRDKVAVGGYHGWHDWYIGTTTRKLGVPGAVSKLTTTFPFNDADVLAKLLATEPDAYAAIILEPDGAVAPAPGFLAEVRRLADRYGVVLVFDEIICGFRINLGGAQAEHGVTPDLSAMGKSMGNGMPISAIAGRRDIMKLMDKIFFSATFGGEALSLAASIATIGKLERENIVPRLRRLGRDLMAKSNVIFEKHGFGGVVSFAGNDWWPRMTIENTPAPLNLFKSLMRQEFYANGLLMGASLNLSLAHDSEPVIQDTLAGLDRTFGALRDHLDSKNPAARLLGKEIQPTFSVR